MKKQIIQLKENKKCAYMPIIGQCSPDLDSKLQGSAAFVQADADQDAVQLLLVIRGYCCHFDDHQRPFALKQAKYQVSTYYQAHDVTNTEYVEPFKALVGVVEMYGSAYGRELRLVATELVAQGMNSEDVTTTDRTAIIKAKEVCGANNGRYHQFKLDLSNDMTKGANKMLNDMTKGTDNYLKTIVETMCMITNYVPPAKIVACARSGWRGTGLHPRQGWRVARSKEGHYMLPLPRIALQERVP